VRNHPIPVRLLAFAAIVVVVACVFQSLTPTFLTAENLRGLLRHMAINGLASLGLTFVIVVRHVDLSFPGVASLGAMTLGWLISTNAPLLEAVCGAMAVGAAFGLLNGIAVARLKLPDIVTTIATGGLAIGLAYFYSDGTTISQNFMMSGLLDLNDAKVFGIDEPFAILLATAVIAYLVLHTSRAGHAFYATGENPVSARFSGIGVHRTVVLAFIICGVTGCLAIMLLVASAGASDVTAGNQLLMPAFAAVYLGAALFGRPSVPATMAGTLLMSMMLSGFVLLATPYYYSDAIVSTVLIVAILAFDPGILRAVQHSIPSGRERAV
jgi:ribose transport system permease protein